MKEPALRKVTILLPRDLVKRATAATGKGLTPTIRQGLEAVARAAAYDGLRQLRGKVRLSVAVEALRED